MYWFIPALAKSRVGSSCGTTLLDGQCVCFWPTKYLRARWCRQMTRAPGPRPRRDGTPGPRWTKVSRIFFAGHPSGVFGTRRFLANSSVAKELIVPARLRLLLGEDLSVQGEGGQEKVQH